MKTKLTSIIAIATFSFAAQFLHAQTPAHKPTLYLIGDSTVKNGRDTGSGN